MGVGVDYMGLGSAKVRLEEGLRKVEGGYRGFGFKGKNSEERELEMCYCNMVVGCVDTLYCVTSSSRQDTSLGTGSRKVSDGR